MKPLSDEDIAAGWIGWSGGACPVVNNTAVDICRRNKVCSSNFGAAGWRWGWSGSDDDIIAYRFSDQGEVLQAAVHEGVDKLGDERLPRFHKLGMRYEEQNKAMGDDKPAKDLRQLGRFSHHDTAFTTHVFYDEHPIAMITDDVISWSYHMPDMKKAASEAMHVYLGRVWK